MPSGVYERKGKREIVEYLIAHASPDLTRSELTVMVQRDVNPEATYEYVRKKVTELGLPSKAGRAGSNRIFNDEQAEYVVSIVKGRPTAEVAEMVNEKYGLNITSKQIYSWKKNHKTPSGYDTRFRRGHVCLTKGVKWSEWMPPESQERSRQTTFKKGNRPANYLPVGTIVCRPNSGGYLYIKVSDSPAKWRLYQHVVWEENFGPIPEGHKITFRDKDIHNCSPENLIAVSDAAIAIANFKIGMTPDAEINEAIYATAELLSKINGIKKKKENKKGQRRRCK